MKPFLELPRDPVEELVLPFTEHRHNSQNTMSVRWDCKAWSTYRSHWLL